MTGGAVRVPSLSRPDASYVVTPRGDALVCDCPRAGFLGLARAEEDKHVRLVRRADALLAKCAEAHGADAAGRLCRQCLVSLLALTAGKVGRDYVPRAEARARIAAARRKRTRKPKHEEAT